MLYNFQTSGEKYFEQIHMYSGLSVDVSKKKYFKSHDKKGDTLPESDMLMFKSNFVSGRYAMGSAVTSKQYSLSPPTASHTWKVSDFKGR